MARGSSPALIWYGRGAERIELSGTVLAYHCAKVSNYLTGELDPGAQILLDLPTHWKSIVWAFGGLLAGGNAIVNDDGTAGPEPADAPRLSPNLETALVTNRPEHWAGNALPGSIQPDLFVALNMDSLGFAWRGELPDGVDDGAAAALSQPDALMLSYGEESNAEQWQALLGSALPADSRLLLTDPTLATAISFTYNALAQGKVAIIGPAASAESIITAEGAAQFRVS